MAKKEATTINIDPALKEAVKAEAEKVGLGWTTLISVLVREALAARQRA